MTGLHMHISTTRPSVFQPLLDKYPHSSFFQVLVDRPDSFIPKEACTPNKHAVDIFPQTATLFTQPHSGGEPSGHSLQLWLPQGPWKWAQDQPLSATRCIDKEPGDGNELWYGVGIIADQEIAFFAKSWNVQHHTKDFLRELAFNKAQLTPLHGLWAPSPIGVYGTGEHTVDVVYELPHSAFWITPSPDMPNCLKKRCIQAYHQLHACGVVHGHINLLANITIGGDGRVMLLNFERSRAVEPLNNMCQERTTEKHMRLEMRRIKCLLDYEDARQLEMERWLNFTAKLERNRALSERATADPLYVADFEEGTLDEKENPPVDPEQTGWYDPLFEPLKFVVPGTTEDEHNAAIQKFLEILKRMARDDNDEPGNGVEIESSIASLPSTPITPVDQTFPTSVEGTPKSKSRYLLRKRKASADSTDHTTSTVGSSMDTIAHATPHIEAGPSSSSTAPHSILKVKKSPHLHASIPLNNQNESLPPITARDHYLENLAPWRQSAPTTNDLFTFPPNLSSKDRRILTARRLVMRHQEREGSPSYRPWTEEEKVSREEERRRKEAEEDRRPSKRRKTKDKRTSFASAPDVYIKQYVLPKESWHIFARNTTKAKEKRRARKMRRSVGQPVFDETQVHMDHLRLQASSTTTPDMCPFPTFDDHSLVRNDTPRPSSPPSPPSPTQRRQRSPSPPAYSYLSVSWDEPQESPRLLPDLGDPINTSSDAPSADAMHVIPHPHTPALPHTVSCSPTRNNAKMPPDSLFSTIFPFTFSFPVPSVLRWLGLC